MAANGAIKDESHLDVPDAPTQKEMTNLFNGDEDGAVQPADVKAQSASSIAKSVTTRALQFLSTASPETLGACFVGLGASTYFVFGRLGLIFIGVAGGVVLHATWEDGASNQLDATARDIEARKRREKSLDIASRLLDYREKTKEEAGQDTQTQSVVSQEVDFDGFQQDTKAALEELTDAVIRDYVKYWYSPLLPNDIAFPKTCRQTFTRFLISISNQMSRKQPADTFLDFVTNSSSILIVFLNELATALKASPGAEPLEAIEEYVIDNAGCSLANVLDEDQQQKKLKTIAEDILQNFLDLRSYSCEPVRTFLREVLAGLILDMTIVSCSKPDFINDWIIYALEDGETTELVQAIDAGVSGATANGSVIPAAIAKAESSLASQDADSASSQSTAAGNHKRTVSRAETVMEEAMKEAKRLTDLIAEEESKKDREVEAEPRVKKREITSAIDLSPPESAGLEAAAPPLSEDKPAEKSDPYIDTAKPGFTSFDQILSSTPTALQSSPTSTQPAPAAPMTIHNAKISIFDDSVPGEKTAVKSKPTVEYLLQIEPAVSQYPGWMIPRKYSDFETLHEVLRRISVISGASAFANRHQTLPAWKGKTKSGLRTDLQNYLQDALSFQPLAESEGMKRFLEKEQGLAKASPSGNKSGFGFPAQNAFENMGKGVLDVLSSAPKGAAGGGKAIVGGVTGVFGGIAKKQSTVQVEREKPASRSTTSLAPVDNAVSARKSQEIERPPANGSVQVSPDDTKPPPLPARHNSSKDNLSSHERNSEYSQPNPADIAAVPSTVNLPPPPSEITDDYSTVRSSPKPSLDETASVRTSTSTDPSPEPATASQASKSHLQTKAPPRPLTSSETTVAIELFFAIITELYSLSSAWAFRLTLLSAAKTFLLRPSNPNLDAIRQLLQATLIDPYTSDSGIADMIRKTRANALPTEEELKAWPDESAIPLVERERRGDEKRRKARKLLVERGMPTALTGVMGQAASGEALGKVFDCLQGEKVARGLVFALTLQAIRAVTQ